MLSSSAKILLVHRDESSALSVVDVSSAERHTMRDFMLSCHDFTRVSNSCLALVSLKAFYFFACVCTATRAKRCW